MAGQGRKDDSHPFKPDAQRADACRLRPRACVQVAEQGREDIVYRSGRVRAPNETNGKACNLNNTLHWLYPADKCVSDEEVGCPGCAELGCVTLQLVATMAHAAAGLLRLAAWLALQSPVQTACRVCWLPSSCGSMFLACITGAA